MSEILPEQPEITLLLVSESFKPRRRRRRLVLLLPHLVLPRRQSPNGVHQLRRVTTSLHHSELACSAATHYCFFSCSRPPWYTHTRGHARAYLTHARAAAFVLAALTDGCMHACRRACLIT